MNEQDQVKVDRAQRFKRPNFNAYEDLWQVEHTWKEILGEYLANRASGEVVVLLGALAALSLNAAKIAGAGSSLTTASLVCVLAISGMQLLIGAGAFGLLWKKDAANRKESPNQSSNVGDEHLGEGETGKPAR